MVTPDASPAQSADHRASFREEARSFVADGYVLVGRIGYLGGYELRARASGAIDRVDHDGFVQLVVSRDAMRVLVRIEAPDRPSPQLAILERDDTCDDVALIVGPLYVGGRVRLVELVTDPEHAEARFGQSVLPSCWVDAPAPGCC